MSQMIMLSGGGRIDIREDGCIVISDTGEYSWYGNDGRLIGAGRFYGQEAPGWLKHFFFMGELKRRQVKKWHQKQRGETDYQKKFLDIVQEALDEVQYDYYIATIEPSEGQNGEIVYQKYAEVYEGLNCYDWKRKAEEFAPEYGSRLSSVYELYLWYAYRIACDYWTLEEVCDDSSELGNYFNAPNSQKMFEPSGARVVGGFSDGVGNTCKTVENSLGGFCLIGGRYNDLGHLCPVADIYHYSYPDKEYSGSTGVVVLRAGML